MILFKTETVIAFFLIWRIIDGNEPEEDEIMTNSKTLILTRTALMASMIAVCSWITVPFVVPFTLQTFAVITALETLGGKQGTRAIALYLLLGAAGLPVFSGFQGGIGKLMDSTGGYLLGFLLLGLIYQAAVSFFGDSFTVRVIALLTGQLVLYCVGTLWFAAVYSRANGPVTLWTVLCWCVFPFIGPDLVKLCAALLVSSALRKALPTLQTD